ncbi:hypothetical protein [Micromonospora inositola]|uniref:Uncharacterized protein n=1 Tax=Micromonospora inositola TaxID=47865 RepID=A0A1C5IQG6_9ACTN|nr:hypothetical protein [Micromonospora inositola]SCG60026.1 hypothetical protein GA0070613_3187 [Micromonospora inositola]
MRRPLAATMVTAVLLTGAACADNDSNPFSVGFASPAPSATAAPGVSGTPTPTPTGDAGVCLAAKRAGSTAVQTYVQKLAEMLTVGRTDRAAADAARRDAEAALAGWRDALRQQSGRATDPQLKTLLADLATEVGSLGTDVEKIDEAEFDRLQQRLDELCPR